VKHFLQQTVPAAEGSPASKVCIKHCAGAIPHFGNSAGICAKAAQRLGEKLAVAGLHDNPAIVPTDKSGDFSVYSGDRDDGSTGGGDPVELTRHYEAFELGPQRN
jgi:hypothetical protein